MAGHMQRRIWAMVIRRLACVVVLGLVVQAGCGAEIGNSACRPRVLSCPSTSDPVLVNNLVLLEFAFDCREAWPDATFEITGEAELSGTTINFVGGSTVVAAVRVAPSAAGQITVQMILIDGNGDELTVACVFEAAQDEFARRTKTR